MTRKVTSYRLTDMTLRQIKELTTTTGASDANVIAHAIDRMHQQEIAAMNIRKPDNLHVEFKSLDWQNAVVTMEPKEAVRLLAKEVEALVEHNCAGQTQQQKSRQAELVHNGFVARAYPHLTGTRNSLFYRDVAREMYSSKHIHEKVDTDY